MKMLVSVDGSGFREASEVKVVYETGNAETLDGDPVVDRRLHVGLTPEGVVADLVDDGDVVDGTCETVKEVVARIEAQ